MKVFTIYAMAVGLLMLAGCRKDKPVVLSPDKEIRLKDVSQKNLPSPFYHFEYNSDGRILKVGSAAGEASYEVIYTGSQFVEMKNTAVSNKDRIQYLYNDRLQVELIKILTEAGSISRLAELTYDVNARLQQIEWELKIPGQGSALEQTMEFSYDSKGNLSELRDKRHFIENRQQEALYIDRFEQYDDGVNVDGFELLHTNGRHLILLPGIQLQHNNPAKNIRTGDGVNYVINYSYHYDGKNPLQKNGDMLMTNGQNAGQHFQVGSVFTYY